MRRIPAALGLSLPALSLAAALSSCGDRVASGAGGSNSVSASHSSSSIASGSASSGVGGAGGGDSGSDASAGLACGAILACDQACATPACESGCYAQGTGVGQGLLDAFTQCLGEACPDGGSACDEAAAMNGCIVSYATCMADTSTGPADPDGGGVVVPDAGQLYDCSGLQACIAGCTKGDGACISKCSVNATNTAVALDNSLSSCLSMACPSTASGPCETQGPTCTGCIQEATTSSSGACAAPYAACQNDGSADAG